MTDFLRPVAWYQRDRTVRAVRSIAPKLDRPDLHDLVQKVENAAAVEDDRAFLEAPSPSSRVGPKVDAETQASEPMERIARNLERLSEARGLDPVFLQELNEAAEIGDTQRFFAAVGHILAALKESREQAKLEAS